MATVTVTAPGTPDDTWTEIVRVATAVCGRAQGGGSWVRNDEQRRITAQLHLDPAQVEQVQHDFQGLRMCYSEAAVEFTPDEG
jgi:hypothetical protein